MKEILFFTAYSGHAPFVFRYALTLARHFQATVSLLHVYEGVAPELATTGAVLEQGAGILDRFAHMLEHQQLEKIQQFARRHTPSEMREVPLHFEVRTGLPAEEMLALQREREAGLIVMGAKVRNTIGEAIFGTLALQMVDRAPCPVLLVPPLAQYIGVSKIVYASNFSYRDEAVIRQLLEWGEAFEATLHVVHVYQDEEGRREAQSSMQNLARNFDQGIKLHFELVEGEVASQLDAYGDRLGADLVATTSQKRGFWENLLGRSTTRDIASEVEIPILIFKE